MRGTQKSSRRAVLSAIGAGLTAGVFGAEATAQRGGESQYAIEQGDDCVPVQPVRGQLAAEEFYDFQLPEQYVTAANGAFVGNDAPYSSAGTLAFQRARTSIAFLYRNSGGLYLVVVHGSARNPDAGAVTFRISGLPEDGEWIVKDDFYRNPDTGELAATNYDRWDVDGRTHRIDWTWGSAGTDGGTFGELGDDFEIVVYPAFNEAATLYGEHYEGTVTDWEFLSGPDGDERIPLALDEPIRIRTGRCGGQSASRGTTEQQQQVEQEQEAEIEQEQRTETQETERNEQRQQQETERDGQSQQQESQQESQRAQDQDQEGEQSQKQEIEQSQTGHEGEQKQEAEIEQEQQREGERNQQTAQEDDEGRGNGHERGRGKGHEKGRGKGHEKHGDDSDDGDDDDDDDDDDDGEDDGDDDGDDGGNEDEEEDEDE